MSVSLILRRARGRLALLIVPSLILATGAMMFVVKPFGTEGISAATYTPTTLPLRLVKAGHSIDEASADGYVRREEHFDWRTEPASATSEELRDWPLTVATTAYQEDRLTPGLDRRFSGEVYLRIDAEVPEVRRVSVRGHEAALEIFAAGDDGRTLMLTWIERPGVYIQIVGRGIPEDEILSIAGGLREV